jgi:predicted DNA-binding transcriptional regulator AlpA
MSVITIDSKAFKIILDKLSFLETSIKVMSINNGYSRWMNEDEVMAVTGLSKKSLQLKRRAMTFNWSSATGRKIKYLRKDVDAYINENSTIHK